MECKNPIFISGPGKAGQDISGYCPSIVLA